MADKGNPDEMRTIGELKCAIGPHRTKMRDMRDKIDEFEKAMKDSQELGNCNVKVELNDDHKSIYPVIKLDMALGSLTKDQRKRFLERIVKESNELFHEIKNRMAKERNLKAHQLEKEIKQISETNG